MTERYAFNYYANASEEMKRWFDSLTQEQRQELGRLDYRNGAYPELTEPQIVMDWIEEHGGKRLWWNMFNVYIEIIQFTE